MARVIGLFKLRGSIDDLTFRHTQDGIIAGMKPGPTRERVLTHENFALTRRNAEEFQQAIKDARLLRHALGSGLDGRTGSSMNGRMNGVFYKAARRDEISDLGFRRAYQGNIDLLTGFNFNKQLSLAYAMPVPLTHSLDVESGTCKAEVPSFIARKRKDFPAGATHFQLISGMVVIDFLHGKYEQHIQRGELLPLRKKTPGVIGFEHAIDRMSGQVVVQVLGMEFYKLAGEYPVLVKGSALQVLEVVRLNHDLKDLKDLEESEGIGAGRQSDIEVLVREDANLSGDLIVESPGLRVGREGIEFEDTLICEGTGQGMDLAFEDPEPGLHGCSAALSEMPSIFEDGFL